MKIAAAYLRVSTERQDEYSLDSQLKLIRDYASKNDYIVPEEFVFCDDGISGRSAKKRTEFQRMIGWAKDKARPFEAILVWKFSRFARNQEESIVYKSMLQRCGVEVISISEPLAEGPFGSLIERILEWMDEFYSIRLSGEVKRGMAEKVSRGEPVAPAPFGYDNGDKILIPNADADIVRRVFADYLSGKGIRQIATELGTQGITTRRGCPPDNRFVEYLLRNPVYIGKIRWSKEGRAASRRDFDNPNIVIADGNHVPLVEEKVFRAVQEKLSQTKKAYGKHGRSEQPIEWMLKGLVRCSSCGATLVRQSTACPSMQCHNYAKGSCLVSHALSIRKADAMVIEALENCLAMDFFPLSPELKKPDPNRPNYEKLLSLETAKLRRVQEAYEAGIDTLEEYALKKRKITAQISTLHRQAEETAKKETVEPALYRQKVVEVLNTIKDDTVSQELKNKALHSVLSHIIYEKPQNRLALYFYI